MSCRSIGPVCRNGIVTTPHYLASQAGLDILRRGGTAVDAIIAATAVLSVVYPHMCGIGGDNFWLIYSAADGTLKGLHADGAAGRNVDADLYTRQGLTHIPSRGYQAAITVPGAVSGWHEAFLYSNGVMGSPLAWEELLQSAIMYAQEGFPVSSSLAYWLHANTGKGETRELQRLSGFSAMFLKNGVDLYREGDVAAYPDLARTLERIAKEGADAFYRGDIAKAIADDMGNKGGLLCLEDFKTHRARWTKPLCVPYRDFQACNLPPATQGMASLAILRILDQFDVPSLGEGTADYYHLLVEATKEAFADRDAVLCDPDFAEVPVDALLSQEHAEKQAIRIRMDRAAQALAPLRPGGDTVWTGAVDGYGNAVSMIQSIYHDFGSGIVPRGTGVLLQNRGCCFSLDSTHVNRLLPGKRTFHTLNPAMLLKDGRPRLVYGTMGGEGQPQTQAALVTRIVDFHMDPQEAVTAPRWLYGRTWGEEDNKLKLEGRIPQTVVEDLARRGHPVRRVADFTDMMGHAGAVLIHDTIMRGASDPRSDGLAAGF